VLDLSFVVGAWEGARARDIPAALSGKVNTDEGWKNAAVRWGRGGQSDKIMKMLPEKSRCLASTCLLVLSKVAIPESPFPVFNHRRLQVSLQAPSFVGMTVLSIS